MSALHICTQFGLKAPVVSPKILNWVPYRNDVEKVTSSPTVRCMFCRRPSTPNTVHVGSLLPSQRTTSSDTFVMCGCDTNANANMVMQIAKGHGLKMLG